MRSLRYTTLDGKEKMGHRGGGKSTREEIKNARRGPGEIGGSPKRSSGGNTPDISSKSGIPLKVG